MTTVYKLIEKLDSLSHELIEGAAPDIARAVKVVMLRTINAHESPLGVPWKPRKRGRAPVLDQADESLGVVAIGPRIIMRVIGPTARHHKGAVKGGTVREVILSNKTGLTPAVLQAIQRVVTEHWNAAHG
jgi:hypothetical protein